MTHSTTLSSCPKSESGFRRLGLIGTALIGAGVMSLVQTPAFAQSAPIRPVCDWAGQWTTELGDLTIREVDGKWVGESSASDVFSIVIRNKPTRDRCEIFLFYNMNGGGYLRVDPAVLNGDSFTGLTEDKFTPGGKMTTLRGTRRSKARSLQMEAVRRAGPLGQVNPTVKRKAVPRVAPTFGGSVKTSRPSGSTAGAGPATTAFGLSKHLPYLAQKRPDFTPRYIELELTDFRNETGASGDVYGLLGFYAGCMTEAGPQNAKPLGGQKNRVLNSERGASNAGGTTAILRRPARERTRRFALDASCFDKRGGEVFVQAQTNLKRHMPAMIDPVFGYRGFLVNLSDLMNTDEGRLNTQANLNTSLGELGCISGAVNTVTRAPKADTANSMAFDWRFSVTAPLLTVPYCDYLTQSTVRIRLVE